jgi:anti-sigma factor RsiW
MSTYRTSCGETLEKLPLYVGGDLDPEGLASVQSHVESCPACAERVQQALRARTQLSEALRPGADGVGPSLWTEIRGALVAEGLIHAGLPRTGLASAARSARPSARAPRSTMGRRLRWLAPLAAAAAVLAVLHGTGLLSPAVSDPAGQRAPEIAAPEAPSQGTLRRIDPSAVEPLVPFKAPRPTLEDRSWGLGSPILPAGFRPRRR